jgi:hypothetical protein
MIDDPTVKAVAEKVRTLIKGARQQYARKLYSAGVELLLVADIPGAISDISGELGISGTALYNYTLLPKAWQADEFTKLTAMTNSKGLHLTATHFIALARGDDKKKRYNILRRCLKESLNVKQVQREMSDLQYGLTAETKGKLSAILVSKSGSDVLDTLFEAMKEHASLREVVTYLLEEAST